MNKRTKIALYVLLALSACLFTWRFKTSYTRLMAGDGGQNESDVTNLKLPDYEKKAPPARTDYHLGALGAAMVLSLVGLGLLVAHDLSDFLGARALKAIYDDESTIVDNPGYEQAEAEWANGRFLEAVQLMRDYLKENPREQHVALRIAEIYEKDLQNFLAAALEYEEVLKQNLPPERWGWAAIHLCNLYTSKLNQNGKALDLLQRIATEYGETAAAEKARNRLSQLDQDGGPRPEGDAPAEAAPSSPSLPPGFAPKQS